MCLVKNRKVENCKCKEIYINTFSELSILNTEALIGSFAFVLEDKNFYYLNSDKKWVIQ